MQVQQFGDGIVGRCDAKASLFDDGQFRAVQRLNVQIFYAYIKAELINYALKVYL